MAGTHRNDPEAEVFDLIRSTSSARRYPAGTNIFREGEPGGGVYLVESGLLRIDRTTYGGKVALLDLAGKGDLIGELSVIDGAPRSARLSTVTDCSMRFVSTAAFATLMDANRKVDAYLLQRLTRRLRSLSTQFVEAATLDSAARVSARLLRLVDIQESLGRLHVDDAGVIIVPMPINQEELGEWVGLGREGTVKGLRTLRSIGAITTGRKRVEIHDIEELKRRAK